MAFQPINLVRWSPVYPPSPSALPVPIAALPGLPQQWAYQADADTMADVQVSGYFVYFADWQNTFEYNNGNFLQVGDTIYCVCSDGYLILFVTSITSPITTEALAIPSGSITTSDLANQAVTAAKIANNTITAAQIANGTITSTQLSPSIGLTVPQGGTGIVSDTAYAVICGGTTSTAALQSLSSVGTSGQVLTSNGAAMLPSFQTLVGVGGLTLLASASASTSATIDFTSALSGTYDNYLIVFDNVTADTDIVNFYAQVGTPTYQTASYASASFGAFTFSTGTAFSSNNATSAFDLTGGTQVLLDTASVVGGKLLLTNCNSSVAFKSLNSDLGGLCYSSAQTADFEARICSGGSWESGTVIDSIRFLMSSGNILTGNFYLYGLQL